MIASTDVNSVSFILTGLCNYRCEYCYAHNDESRITNSIIDKAIAKLLVLVQTGGSVSFYGGEPLLCIEELMYIVKTISKCRDDITFSLTTNGSLIDDKILEFLSEYKFTVMLSYDGERLQSNRDRGSASLLKRKILDLTNSKSLKLIVNSVFTNDTYMFLPEVLNEILNYDIKHYRYSFDKTSSWNVDQIDSLERIQKKIIDLSITDGWLEKIDNFSNESIRSSTSCFVCTGGANVLAVDPSGNVWGCYRFWDIANTKPDYCDLDKYRIGSVYDDTEKLYANINKKVYDYNLLRVDQYYTDTKFCRNCKHVNDCSICPIELLNLGDLIDKVPNWLCNFKKSDLRVKEYLGNAIGL